MPATGHLLLTPAAPVVALTRLASGVGALTIEVAVPRGAAEVRLGCAYTLASGQESFVDSAAGAPAGSPRPPVAGGRDRITLDLRQVRDLARALLVVQAVAHAPATWDAMLVLTTHAGSRIDVPLASAPSSVAVAAVSLAQVRGEIVVRAELDPADSARAACAAFGYEAISWLDNATALS